MAHGRSVTFLHVLLMEHLEAALTANEENKGVQIATDAHKMALFTNDLLLFTTQLAISLPDIMAKFERFGKFKQF